MHGGHGGHVVGRRLITTLRQARGYRVQHTVDDPVHGWDESLFGGHPWWSGGKEEVDYQCASKQEAGRRHVAWERAAFPPEVDHNQLGNHEEGEVHGRTEGVQDSPSIQRAAQEMILEPYGRYRDQPPQGFQADHIEELGVGLHPRSHGGSKAREKGKAQ